MDVHQIEAVAAQYPACLRARLGAAAPPQLTALGNLDLLALPKTALFCSARCPGKVILTTYDQAAKWRDAGRCVISGFHSPVEKECLQILLRGSQPIIICPARTLPQRVPPDWKKPLAARRLLILSAFSGTAKRVTADLASRRNELVAALADEAFIAHATPGGRMEKIVERVKTWGIPYNGQTSDESPIPEEDDEIFEIDEILEGMKPIWDKLRTEGVPIDKRPLDANLPWSIQFQFQAETDPTGKDMEWWKTHKRKTSSLE